MESNIKKKVNTIGLVGKIISIILIVVMSLACLGSLLGAIVIAVLPKDAITVDFNVDTGVTIGKSLFGSALDEIPDNITFEMPDPDSAEFAEFQEAFAQMKQLHIDLNDLRMEKTPEGLKMQIGMTGFRMKLQEFSGAAFTAFVYCAALLVIMIFLLRLSNAFRKCDTPFSDLVIKRMTVFGWVLLIGSVVASVVEAIGSALILRSIGLTSAMNSAGIPVFSFNLRLAPIVIALVLFFLTMIFRYGAQLQKESDETL